MKNTNKIALLMQMASIICMFFVCSLAYALPQIDQIINGSVNVSHPDEFTLRIDATDKSIIDYSSFDINQNESVFFYLPSADSSILNRVNGMDLSDIFGNLNSNGIFFLVSPGGIHIGPNANIDAASILMSTRDIDNQDFLNGNYLFNKTAGETQDFAIINNGSISIHEGGFGVFIAGGIKNEGKIIANVGKVALVTGDAVRIDFAGNNLISVAVEESVAETIFDHQGNPITDQINNTGEITNNGGLVIMDAKTLPGIFTYAINLDGVVNAEKVSASDGIVQLTTNDEIRLAAEVNATRIAVEASNSNIYLDEGLLIANSSVISGDKVIVRDINPTRFYGDMTFNNFESTIADKKFYFEAGKTYTFNGNFKLAGAYAEHIQLLSSQTGVQWFINPTGTRDITYTWVEDSYNVHPEIIMMSESTSRDNNFNWDPDGYWMSNVSSNWNIAANWSGLGGALPGAGDNVFFTNAHNGNCIINQNITVNNWTVSGYTGKIDNEPQDRTITINGNFSATSGRFDLGSGILNVYGSYLDNQSISYAFDLRAGTLNMLGNGTVKILHYDNRPKYLNLAYPGKTTTMGNGFWAHQVTVNGGTFNFANYALYVYESIFTINAPSTYIGPGRIQYRNFLPGNPFTAYFPSLSSIEGDVNMSNIIFELWGGAADQNGIPGNNLVYITRNLTLKDLQVTHIWQQYTEVNTSGKTITLTGTWTAGLENNQFYDNSYIKLSNSIINLQNGLNFANPYDKVWAQDSIINVLGGNWNVSPQAYFYGDNSQVNFSGNPTITMEPQYNRNYFNSLNFNNANITLNSGIEVKGDLIINGGSLTGPGAYILKLSGSGTQNIDSDGKSFYELWHNSTGSVNLLDDIVLEGQFLNSTGIFNANGFNMSVAGNFINDATVTGLSDLSLLGTGPQSLTLNGAGLNNLFINNTAGVTLFSDLDIEDQLTFSNNSVFDLNGQNISVGSVAWGNNIALKLQGDEVLSGFAGLPNNSGSVEYNGPGTYSSLLLGDEYYNLLFSNGTYSLDNALTVTGDLTIDGANTALDINGNSLSLAADSAFSNEGTFRLNGDEILTNFTLDTDSGTVVYKGSGNYTGLLLGYGYKNITFNGPGSWELLDSLDVEEDLRITAGTLKANEQTITIGGDFTNASTFIHNNNEIILNGAGAQSISSSSSHLYDLTINNTSVNGITLQSDLLMDGTFSLSGNAIFDFAAYDFTTENSQIGNNVKFKLTSDQTITGLGDVSNPSWTVEYTGNGTYTRLTLGDTYYDLLFTGNGTYILDNALTINNNLTINADAKLSLNGHSLTFDPSATLALNGTLGIIGTEIFTNFTLPTENGTIEYNGLETYNGLLLGNQYYNLQFAGAGMYSLTNPLIINNQLSIADESAIFNLNGQTLTLEDGAAFSNIGTLRLIGTETLNNFTNDADSGTIEYAATLTNILPLDYYSLKINVANETWSLAEDINLAGSLNLAAGIITTNNHALNLGGYHQTGGVFNAGSSQITSTGNFIITGGDFNENTSHIILNVTDGDILFTADDYNFYDVTMKNLNVSSDHTIILGAGDVTFEHSLNLITVGNSDLIINASVNNPNITLNGDLTFTHITEMEMILNGSFENGLTSWSDEYGRLWDFPDGFLSQTDASDGSTSLNMWLGLGWDAILFQYFDAIHPLQLTLKVKGFITGDWNDYIELLINDPMWGWNSTGNLPFSVFGGEHTADDWTEISVDMSGWNSINGFGFYSYFGGSGSNLLIDEISLIGEIANANGAGVINAGSGNWAFRQNFDLTGITFNGHTSNVKLISTDGNKTLTSADQAFYNLTVEGPNSWTLVDGLNVTNALNLTGGSFDTAGQIVNVHNLNLNGGELVADGSDITVTGALNFVSGTFDRGTSNIILDTTNNDIVFNAGGYSFYDLTLQNLSLTDDHTAVFGAGNYTIHNNLNFITFYNSNVVLNARANNPNITLNGNLTFTRLNELETIVNGSFEDNLNGWMDIYGNALVANNDSSDGSQSLDMIRTITWLQSSIISQEFDTTSAPVLTFKVKGAVEGWWCDYFNVYITDHNGNSQLVRSFPNDWTSETYQADDWTEVSIDLSVYAGVQGIMFEAFNDMANFSNLLVDAVSIKEQMPDAGIGKAVIQAGAGLWEFANVPDLTGIEFHADQSTVKLSATGIGNITPNIEYYNLNIDGIGSSWMLQDNLTIANDFILTNGTFDTDANNNYSVNVGNAVILNGGIWEARNSNISVTNNWTKTNSGSIFKRGQSHVIFTGEGTVKQGLSAADSLANAFYNLTLGQNGYVSTIDGYVYNLDGVVAIGSGGISGGDLQIWGSGDPLIIDENALINTNIGFRSSDDTFIPEGNYKNIYIYSLDGEDNTYSFSGNVIAASLVIYGNNGCTDTVDTNGYDLTLTGSLTIGKLANQNQTGYLKLNNSNVNINGNLTIHPNDSTGDNRIDAGNANITLAGNFNQLGGIFNGETSHMTVQNDFIIGGGDFNAGTMDLIIDDITGNLDFLANGFTFHNISFTHAINNLPSNNYEHLTLMNGGTASGDITANTFSLAGNFDLDNHNLTVTDLINNGVISTSGNGDNFNIESADLGNITFSNTASMLPAKNYNILTLMNGGTATGDIAASTFSLIGAFQLGNHNFTVTDLINNGVISTFGNGGNFNIESADLGNITFSNTAALLPAKTYDSLMLLDGGGAAGPIYAEHIYLEGSLDLQDYDLTANSFNNYGTVKLAGSQTILINNIYNFGTIEYTGNDLYAGLAFGNTYNNLTFSGSGKYMITNTLTINDSFIINNGNIYADANIFTNNFIIRNGVFHAPSVFNVTGNLTHVTGYFDHRNGLVNLTGGHQTIDGNLNFYGIQKNSGTLSVKAGAMQTVNGNLNLSGTILTSTQNGIPWFLNNQGLYSLYNINVSDSINIGKHIYTNSNPHIILTRCLGWGFTEPAIVEEINNITQNSGRKDDKLKLLVNDTEIKRRLFPEDVLPANASIYIDERAINVSIVEREIQKRSEKYLLSQNKTNPEYTDNPQK